ncbi:polynucleotide kinase-phosphatase [Betaproteobacteria bacterium GR16-43]|nr:polynucleotide kinase-phosphatase [Betaproteobacteria bacterium GR16-43]
MHIEIPELCLVLLVGATSSGKSTFARRHFKPTEVISSDYCRAAITDDENDQASTAEAFDLMHTIIGKRLKLGRLTVADATNVQPNARKGLVALAKQHNVFCAAIVFDLHEKLLLERHAGRKDRAFGDHVIRNQRLDLNRSIRGLEREGIRFVHVLKDPAEIEATTVGRKRLWPNLRHESGPFDIIGDVHGCFDEMLELVRKLGYDAQLKDGAWQVGHPQARRLVFVGDLVDRGPDTPGVIAFVRAAVLSGAAYCVAGNHDAKLVRALQGRDVKRTHGLERSMEQFESVAPEARREAMDFLDGLISHYVMDEGRLVIAHAGLTEDLHGRSSGRVRSFAMYGETTGETDEFGLPVRYNWAKEYRGKPMVVYGHTPVPESEWLNNTICLDTGCVFGGKLTALRYPERELVHVQAAREYYPPTKPLVPAGESLSAQQLADDVLDYADVSGKRYIRTRLHGTVQVREENATAALEVMSRFAADPKWLVYLPPTMSPSDTSKEPGLLEHPAEALDYYAKNGVERVICEEKHMGSRAVVILGKDDGSARRRFGVAEGARGIIYTRTGRRFFNDAAVEREILDRLAAGMEQAGLWDELASDWACLDCELMPWSAKAMELIRGQYAPVGAAGEAMMGRLAELASQASRRSIDVASLASATDERLAAIRAYRKAYAAYCWDVSSVADIRVAPFHVLASEGKVHADRNHGWHMAALARLAAAAPGLVVATPCRFVDLASEKDRAAAIAWWQELTGKGGEGMVVKPLDFIARGKKGLLQPAIKCRGPEYLRIIYGPEYTRAANLERLRERGLSGKRGLALREFALGIESLQRFVERAPLRQVHECVFGVLALESDPVDPRL